MENSMKIHSVESVDCCYSHSSNEQLTGYCEYTIIWWYTIDGLAVAYLLERSY